MNQTAFKKSAVGFCLLLAMNLTACGQDKPATQTPASPPPPAAARPAAQPAQPPSPSVNLLAESNGGQLIAAPFAGWSAIVDGKDDSYVGVNANTEAVFAFTDEKPATFETFEFLVPAAANENVKDFELLVGDSADGEFRSIGKFQAKNLRLMKTNGWQQFKFEPVTAKYFKFRALSRVDGYAGGLVVYEIRLMGFTKK